MDRRQTESKSGLMRVRQQYPCLETLRLEGRAASLRIVECQALLRKTSKRTLLEWLDQAKRLWIAAEIHGLKGTEYVAFADDIGIRNRSTAYELYKLHPYRARVLRQCRMTGHWPGWETALQRAQGEDVGEGQSTDGEVRIERLHGGSNEWGTPLPLFSHYDQIHRFDCDVASSRTLAKCRWHITREQDGLKQPWGKSNWLNPPYEGRSLRRWCKKAWEIAQAGSVVVGLLPAFTEQAWFGDYASHGHIELLQGRLSFDGGRGGFAPFASMIVTWTSASARKGEQLSISIAKHRLGTARPATRTGL